MARGTTLAPVSEEKKPAGEATDGSDDETRSYILEDDDGKEREYDLLAILEYEGKDYALLVPSDDDQTSEKIEISVFEYRAEGDDEFFDEIEDEELYERVVAFCEKELSAHDDDPEAKS